MRPLAEHIERLEFNSMTGVAIALAYWRRRSPGRKRGRRENGRPYEGWKVSKVHAVRPHRLRRLYGLVYRFNAMSATPVLEGGMI